MDIKKLPSYDKQLQSYLETYPNTYITILTPCYGCTTNSSYCSSMISLSSYLTSMGVKFSVFFVSDSLVTRGRNTLIGKAMALSETTHIMFIDADISFHPLDVIKLLVSDKEVIGGVYPIKKYNWSELPQTNHINRIRDLQETKKQYNIFDNISDEEFIQKRMVRYNLNAVDGKLAVEDNMTEVRHIATGFMMIKRNVIEKMAKEYPKTKYFDNMNSSITEKEQKWTYALFDCAISERNNHYLSEDWLFCDRWRNIGGKIFAHVGIDLDHTGVETYKGSFLTSLV